MNLQRYFHQTALDFSMFAQDFVANGRNEEAKKFYLKAFEMEEIAASMNSDSEKDPLSQFILLRSAAALAYKAGLYNESKRLIQLCLSENPPAFIIQDLKDISELIGKELTLIDEMKSTFIEGHLTKVDTDENEITVKDNSKHHHAIMVPPEKMERIAREYILRKVLIEVRQTNHGEMILENIKAAA